MYYANYKGRQKYTNLSQMQKTSQTTITKRGKVIQEVKSSPLPLNTSTTDSISMWMNGDPTCITKIDVECSLSIKTTCTQ